MTVQDVFIKRKFDAPRRRVWQAWTEPEQMMRWWGPKGYTIPSCRMNMQVGGDYLFCMRSPDGQDIWGTGNYREVVEMEKLVMTDDFADKQGNVVPASYYGMEGEWSSQMLVTVTFEELEYCTTLLTVRNSGLPVGEMSKQNEIGWNEMFEKLAEMLAEG